MSELKVYEEMENYVGYDDDTPTEMYAKSDADKAIADLEENHKKEVGQLLIEIAELKKEKEYVIEHTADVINGQERELRHSKYKKCLAMAKWCEVMALFYGNNIPKVLNNDITDSHRQKVFCQLKHYKKWHTHWLQLAEKFKEYK